MEKTKYRRAIEFFHRECGPPSPCVRRRTAPHEASVLCCAVLSFLPVAVRFLACGGVLGTITSLGELLIRPSPVQTCSPLSFSGHTERTTYCSSQPTGQTLHDAHEMLREGWYGNEEDATREVVSKIVARSLEFMNKFISHTGPRPQRSRPQSEERIEGLPGE